MTQGNRMFVVSLFSRDSEACTHAGEERGRQMNRHFPRYTTRSSAGIPSESRLNGDGIEHTSALPGRHLVLDEAVASSEPLRIYVHLLGLFRCPQGSK